MFSLFSAMLHFLEVALEPRTSERIDTSENRLSLEIVKECTSDMSGNQEFAVGS